MATTSISYTVRNTARLVNGPDVVDPNAFGQLLKANYNTVELVNALLDGGDISELGETVDTTSYVVDTAPQYFDQLDIAETQIIPNDYNFVYLNDQWTMREGVEDGYAVL